MASLDARKETVADARSRWVSRLTKIFKWIFFGGLAVIAALSVAAVLLKREFARSDDEYEKRQTTVVAETPLVVGSEYLNHLTDQDIAVILRELRGNPGWFVTAESGRTVAIQREKKNEFSLGFNGYQRITDEIQRKVEIVFGDQRRPPAQSYYSKPGHFQQFSPGSDTVPVQVFNRNGRPANFASYVVVKGSAPLFIEIYEASYGGKERDQTRLALKETEDEIKETLRGREQVARRGVTAAYARTKSSKTSDQLALNCLLPDPQCARHSWSAAFAFNPLVSGTAYLKVRRGEGYITEEYIKSTTLELMGWSADPGVRFLYNANLAIRDLENRYEPVDVELWFSADGGSERKIASKQIQVFTPSCEDDDSCDGFR